LTFLIFITLDRILCYIALVAGAHITSKRKGRSKK
jgi:hypothetical protein